MKATRDSAGATDSVASRAGWSACHPARSEGPCRDRRQVLRCAQNDSIGCGVALALTPTLALTLTLVLALTPHASAGEQPIEGDVLEPNWSRQIAGNIEWMHALELADGGEGLLLCTRDNATLHLLDAHTGKSRIAPLQVHTGSEYIGSADGRIAITAISIAVTAINLTPTAAQSQPSGRPARYPVALRWWTDVSDTAPLERAGDPEHVPSIVAATDTPAGVFVVRSDGALLLLSRDNGTVTWRHDLAPISNATLHAKGSQIAFLWKRETSIVATFIDLREKTREPHHALIDATMPLWSALTNEGVVAVWIDRVGVISRSREPRFVDLSAEPAVWARNCAMCGDEDRVRLLFIASRASSVGRTSLWSVPLEGVDNARISPRCEHSLPSDESHGTSTYQTLRLRASVRSRFAVLSGTRWFNIFDSGAGSWMFPRPLNIGTVRDVDFRPERILVCADAPIAEHAAGLSSPAKYHQTRLCVVRPDRADGELREYLLRIRRSSAKLASEHPIAGPGVRQEGRPGPPRIATFWFAGGFVLRSNDTLSAYPLPAESDSSTASDTDE